MKQSYIKPKEMIYSVLRTLSPIASTVPVTNEEEDVIENDSQVGARNENSSAGSSIGNVWEDEW